MYTEKNLKILQNGHVIGETLNTSSAIRITQALNNNQELKFRDMGEVEAVSSNGSFLGMVRKGHWLRPL